MAKDFDVCVIGSGAGGGPVAWTLAAAGHSVLVLEKGPWLTEQDFFKDDLACCQRSVYTPKLADEQHVIEDLDGYGDWVGEATSVSGWDFWNGNCVGGSSNFMSGFFYRLKPEDFRLRSEFGPIAGANVVDWPISYDDLEPYYTQVETQVGVSGRVVDHPFAERRSTAGFPYPPTQEHPVSSHIDAACKTLGLHPLPTPRAILTQPRDERRSCEYSGYCGSYGCSSGAKGSSRAALLARALRTGNCQIQPHAKVYKLSSDATGKVVAAEYFDADDKPQQVTAKIFVVACQAIETSRLLLSSVGLRHPHGLANRHGQVGRNLLFSAGGSGTGDLVYADVDDTVAAALKTRGPFVNRGLQDWYTIDDQAFGGRAKGGTVDFLLSHPNPIGRALAEKWDADGQLVWGHRLQQRLKAVFTEAQYLRYEIFCDWLPTDDCFVTLDGRVTDKWGTPVAKVRIGYHEHDLKVGRYINARVQPVLAALGAQNIRSSISGSPPQNLVAGGCRFGTDPTTSVLDADCRAHDVDNLYVTDGSFMPTGGSVPYTWTIYANAFRVADRIKARL
ncbi:MAG: GMC family oxidoreductase [Gammaproteobacteria bacterium]|nr:GMC family oxidoreductase [Gammaproteobacteria bacterium]